MRQLSVRVRDLPKVNGVVLLCSPPYVTNKLKPLYRHVYGSFTKFVNYAPDARLRSHTGKPTINNIQSVVSQSLLNALTKEFFPSSPTALTRPWPPILVS
jgi:hypothetical protein